MSSYFPCNLDFYISAQAMHIGGYRELNRGVLGRLSSKPERISHVQTDLGDIVALGPEHRKKASCNMFPCMENLAFNLSKNTTSVKYENTKCKKAEICLKMEMQPDFLSLNC